MAKIFLVMIFIVTISACERQSCKNVACPIGQNCNSGRCFCQDGYEGTNCDVNAFEKYVANNRSWNVSESCYGGSPNFGSYTSFFIHSSSVPSELQIANMLGGNCSVTANIRTDQSNQGNIVEILTQSCGGITVSGQGIYSVTNHTIKFDLNYTLNGTSYQCSHTYY